MLLPTLLATHKERRLACHRLQLPTTHIHSKKISCVCDEIETMNIICIVCLLRRQHLLATHNQTIVNQTYKNIENHFSKHTQQQ
jgi:hypothetical protein